MKRLQDLRSCGGAYAAGVKKVLQADRDAVEHAPVQPARDFLFRLPGPGHCGVRGDCDVGVDLGLQTGNPLEQKTGELNGRQLLAPDQRGKSFDCQIAIVFHFC